jgi:hypothetical protein
MVVSGLSEVLGTLGRILLSYLVHMHSRLRSLRQGQVHVGPITWEGLPHRRGLVRRFTPPDHPSLVPEGHLVEANGHWTTSSMPSARTTRTCATPYGTAGTSSTPSEMADRSSLYHLPHHEEGLASQGNLDNQKGRGWSIPTH